MKKLVLGENQTNCYIVSSGNEAAVIDPGADGEAVFEAVASLGLRVKFILLTHGHFDHIDGVEVLARLSGAEVYVHFLDEELLKDPEKNASRAFGIEVACGVEAKTFSDGEEFAVGDLTLRAVHTPGHTRGSSCFFCGDEVYSGDTVFSDGFGRTDLYGGDHKVMYRTIMALLPKLRGKRIFPGHGDEREF